MLLDMSLLDKSPIDTGLETEFFYRAKSATAYYSVEYYHLLDDRENIWQLSFYPSCTPYHRYAFLEIHKGLTEAYKNGAAILNLYTDPQTGKPYKHENLVKTAKYYDSWNQKLSKACSGSK
ncbi:hypothetical protein NIES593_19495 [Hydrococcus rivularis NIES-593]|uniref:Uncharacterized protein n=1 Tax=Hydrococcus rivularis NIES-593 TaxID=1921803 RepID=A0A1U7H9N6_9CYAN|nr:hypothetical protein [Hydrococcus rivularis]OKH20296.1 hypothetical protein NIES593_19495 [Hydrococcus rivularis NIES-593]